MHHLLRVVHESEMVRTGQAVEKVDMDPIPTRCTSGRDDVKSNLGKLTSLQHRQAPVHLNLPSFINAFINFKALYDALSARS